MYEQGNFQAAKNYFQLSVDEMFKVLAVMKEDGAFAAQQTMSFGDSSKALENEKEGVQHQSPIQGWSYPLPSTTPYPDEEVFLFSRAILLRAPCERSARSVADLRIFKLAIQYNKALTHHQIARSADSKQNGSEDAKIAFYMYKLAFQSCKDKSKAGRLLHYVGPRYPDAGPVQQHGRRVLQQHWVIRGWYAMLQGCLWGCPWYGPITA
jgi:hypothetical protein